MFHCATPGETGAVKKYISDFDDFDDFDDYDDYAPPISPYIYITSRPDIPPWSRW